MTTVDTRRRRDIARAGRMTPWHALALLLAIGVAGAVYIGYGRSAVGVDFAVYHGGSATVLAGGPLYDFSTAFGLPFTYTPFAALAFVPLTVLPAVAAMACWSMISMFSMQAAIWLVLGALGRRAPVRRMRDTALISAAALPMAPLAFNLWVGQINTILLFLVLVDLLGTHTRFRGVAIGIAAGIKLTPLIFIPYLLLTGRTRAARNAALTFACTVLIGFVILPRDAVRYWFTAMFDVSRITLDGSAAPLDASLLGTLKRLHVAYPVAIWLVLAVVVGAVGIAMAVWASRRGHEMSGVLAVGITALLISPVSWVFHWVWCVPLLMLWAARARRRSARAAVVVLWLSFVASFAWIVPQLQLRPVPGFMTLVFANLYVPLGVATLVAIAVSLRRETTRSRLTGRGSTVPAVQKAADDERGAAPVP